MFVYTKGTPKSHKIHGYHVDYKNVPNDEAEELMKGDWFATPKECYDVAVLAEDAPEVEEVKPKATKAKGKGKKNAKK
jgi:hypothetical protein